MTVFEAYITNLGKYAEGQLMQRQAAQQKRSLRSVWKKNDFER